MGQNSSSADKDGKGKNRDKSISGFLNKKKKGGKEEVVILLLGAGECGKTTVFKQMSLLRGGGFNKDYFESMRAKICGNLVDGTFHIIEAARRSGKVAFDDPTSAACDHIFALREKYFNEHFRVPEDDVVEDAAVFKRSIPMDFIDQDMASALADLWKSENYKAAYKEAAREGKTDVSDTYPELMDKLSKEYPDWGGKDWVPNKRDILLVRVRTTGMAQETFEHNQVIFKLIDVGGQRAERRKWMFLFDGVTAVIYVASLSEYDQTLYEDNETNRLKESLDLFQQTTVKDEFSKSAMILFLNKFDLFAKKYAKEKVPINCSGMFEDAPLYEDEEDKVHFPEAIAWFTAKYKSVAPPQKQESVFPHVTSALDEQQMDAAINYCTLHILQENMRVSGLLPPTGTI